MISQSREGPEKLCGVLGVEHAPYDDQGFWRHGFERIGQDYASIRIVTAVEPKFSAVIEYRGECSAFEALQACRPCDGLQTFRDVDVSDAEVPDSSQHGNRVTCIANLVRSGKCGQRQVEQAIVILKHHAAILGVSVPVLTRNQKRCFHVVRHSFDGLPRFMWHGTDHTRHTALDDTRFFCRDKFKRVAKELLVIKSKGRDATGYGWWRDVGGIESSAKSHFQQQIIRRCSREGEERGGGCDFEKSDGFTVVGHFTFFEQC